jgi:hypothetical protein
VILQRLDIDKQIFFRGEGAGQTVIYFPKSLTEVYGNTWPNGISQVWHMAQGRQVAQRLLRGSRGLHSTAGSSRIFGRVSHDCTGDGRRPWSGRRRKGTPHTHGCD